MLFGPAVDTIAVVVVVVVEGGATCTYSIDVNPLVRVPPGDLPTPMTFPQFLRLQLPRHHHSYFVLVFVALKSMVHHLRIQHHTIATPVSGTSGGFDRYPFSGRGDFDFNPTVIVVFWAKKLFFLET